MINNNLILGKYMLKCRRENQIKAQVVSPNNYSEMAKKAITEKQIKFDIYEVNQKRSPL